MVVDHGRGVAGAPIHRWIRTSPSWCADWKNISYPSAGGTRLGHSADTLAQEALRTLQYGKLFADGQCCNRSECERSRSASGLCIRSQTPEPAGSVLRVVVRDLDDRPAIDVLARVVWCQRLAERRFRFGLSVIIENQRVMKRVRPARASRVLAG